MMDAERTASRALELDEGLSEAHVALAWTKLILRKDWAGAETSLLRAIELNPSNPWSYHWYAYFVVSQGRIAEGLELNARAVALDPFSVPINSIRGWILYVSGDYEGSKGQCRATVGIEPAHPGPHAYLAMAYQQLGEYEHGIQEMEVAYDLGGNMSILRSLLGHAYALGNRKAEANQIAAELEITAQSTYVCAYYMAVLYAGLGDYQKVAHWLLRGIEDCDSWVLYLKMDPRLAAFRTDRRFAEVQRALSDPVTKLTQDVS
jgi:tetratricopeptide (TPR) repeat protein